MADSIQLKHPFRQGDWKFYFYEGELDVEDGVITIPTDRPEWVQRAWIQGFRHDTDGVSVNGDRLAAMMAGDSQEEQEVTDEQPKTRTRRGRQSRANNRVRKSEPASSEDADQGGSQGGVSGGAGEQE